MAWVSSPWAAPSPEKRGREGRREASHLQPCLRPAHTGTTAGLGLYLTHLVSWMWQRRTPRAREPLTGSRSPASP